MALAKVVDAANDLLLLAAEVAILEPVQEYAGCVLQACEVLERQARQLPKAGFAGRIVGNAALLSLDELVDNDVISVVEERFALALGEVAEGGVAEMMRQLLEKLEKKLALLNENIQQLGGLLNEAE
ncbi:hypothetical protein [Methylomonas rivi]|uniref:Uncharacterized protein n=1 Tax=Methylomonas rivi TaxID=2952226 RepID=A0ABT1U5W7_9GAMM|nr:hypothetical protein [Methylomonas sp. WSC-6]MCQ8129255.1 hypothetical protein [Methylomonas sp. WSC-6]